MLKKIYVGSIILQKLYSFELYYKKINLKLYPFRFYLHNKGYQVRPIIV